jgi:hypothetical protein
MSLLVTFLIAIALALILRWMNRKLIEFLQSVDRELSKDDERRRDD